MTFDCFDVHCYEEVVFLSYDLLSDLYQVQLSARMRPDFVDAAICHCELASPHCQVLHPCL